jgi:hypothetical protein
MTIWIETLNRVHDVVARVRVDGDSATIGRAYDNDVVLDDPYVAAHHARVARDAQGEIVAHDLGSENGLYDREGRRVPHVAVDGDHIVRVGHTLLRVRDERYRVVPERRAFEPTPQGRVAAALAIVLVALLAIELWLGETGEPRASRYVLQVLAIVGVIAVWTTSWALLSRLFSGSARFSTHLAIALAGMIVFDLYDTLDGFLTYSLSLEALARSRYVAGWTFVGVLAFFHLRAIGPRHLPAKGGIVALVVAAAVGAQTLVQAEAQRASGRGPYMTRLMPPAARMRTPDSLPEFFARTDTLKAALDRAREEEPADDSMSSLWPEP